LSEDIGSLLAQWKFDTEAFQARVIQGDDGTEKLQMRIDLGIMQMERDGRPDGLRPEGFESLLEQYEAKAESAAADAAKFALSPLDCKLLMQEGLQYYHRYLAAFHLELYDLVARDTKRNLRLFAFVFRHAARQRDKLEFDQYRPYVEMMHARALASQALNEGAHDDALARIDEGIAAIRRFLKDHHQEKREADCSELRFLVRWRREVARQRPLGPIERLKQQLALSVELENYEEAARLRDQIERLQASESRN
jgi:UvrB/uvrC motif